MKHICDKNIDCKKCKHYRFDEDYGEFTCLAKHDEFVEALKDYTPEFMLVKAAEQMKEIDFFKGKTK